MPTLADVPSLAVVIPAYKARFLEASLRSIAAQTDQRFQLYVCDDGSPEDLAAIFQRVFPHPGGNATFHRFDDNLGGHSLVQQWNRCVRLTNATWIWLFSDDDCADPDCVRRFYETLAATPPGQASDLYRFNTAYLNEEGRVVLLSPAHPARETAVEFAYHRLCRTRASFAVEYIFTRAAFDRCDGFVEFPFALGSDDASWITFCGGGQIVLIEGAHVYWRTSPLNTSRLSGQRLGEKLLGLHRFSLWMKDRLSRAPFAPGTLLGTLDTDTLASNWFLAEFNYIRQFISPGVVERVAGDLARQTGWSKRYFRTKLWISNVRFLTSRLLEIGKRGVKRHA